MAAGLGGRGKGRAAGARRWRGAARREGELRDQGEEERWGSSERGSRSSLCVCVAAEGGWRGSMGVGDRALGAARVRSGVQLGLWVA